jgi:hypothetical protein
VPAPLPVLDLLQAVVQLHQAHHQLNLK